MDSEDCRHLTVVSLHDTGPWCQSKNSDLAHFPNRLGAHAGILLRSSGDFVKAIIFMMIMMMKVITTIMMVMTTKTTATENASDHYNLIVLMMMMMMIRIMIINVHSFLLILSIP